MLTVNLHGIGRYTRRPGPGISIYSKSVGCSISSLDHSRSSKYTILASDILRCSSERLSLRSFYYLHGIVFTGDGNIVRNTTVYEDLGETSRGIPDEQSLELRNLVRNSFLLSMGCFPLCFLIMSYSVSTVIIILIKQKNNNNIVGDLSRTANKQHHMPQDNS